MNQLVVLAGWIVLGTGVAGVAAGAGLAVLARAYVKAVERLLP